MTMTTTKALWAALGALLVIGATGCSSAPCDDACSTTETCNATTDECEPAVVNLCAAVTCPAGFGCDSNSGKCMNLCSRDPRPSCTAPETCKPETGTCVNLCAGKTCDNSTLQCNPVNGACEPKCKPTTCTAEQTCEAATGTCANKCESESKPAGKPACAAKLKCKATSGQCVPLCDGKECGYGLWCDDADGACKGGQAAAGRPGSACVADGDCHVANPSAGQEFQCLTTVQDLTFAGGYCTATCSASALCPSGSACTQFGCVDQCAKNSDCRTGYACAPIGGGEYACLEAGQCTKTEPSECSQVGGDCVSSEDCAYGASCRPELEENDAGNLEFSGFDNGMCVLQQRSTEPCPTGSTQVQISEEDPFLVLCLKSCTAGQIGVQGCGLGESCLILAQGSTSGICWQENCDVDTNCQVSTCTTATVADDCGTGQTCTAGKCHTADKCDAAGKCQFGTCNTVTNECFLSYCEASLGRCLPDCTLDAAICPAGTTCNAASKKCDRACVSDLNCGGNGACVGAQCVARCTMNNEKDVCATGQACNSATGRCAAKCTDDASCGASNTCQVSTGRCFRKCNADTNPLACTQDKICNEVTGGCDTKCTRTNEVTVCGGTSFCQTSSGRCLADCSSNEALCSAESCTKLETTLDVYIGVCGVDCAADSDCGTKKTPSGKRVTCQGTTDRRCSTVKCTTANAGTVCTASEVCSDGECVID